MHRKLGPESVETTRDSPHLVSAIPVPCRSTVLCGGVLGVLDLDTFCGTSGLLGMGELETAGPSLALESYFPRFCCGLGLGFGFKVHGGKVGWMIPGRWDEMR